MSGGLGKHNFNIISQGDAITLSGLEGTTKANRALICGASKELDVINATELQIGSTTVTATAAEINTGVDGITATAAELNRTSDISARIITSTATALSLTVTEHAERVVLVNSNTTSANTFSLPAAAGTGAKFTVVTGVQTTQGSIVVAANGTDVMSGIAYNVGTTGQAATAFPTTATSDKITINGTTTGGAGTAGGDVIECYDIAANTWKVVVQLVGSGSLATPFSAT